MALTYEQIKKVNDSLKTTDIKGKDYVEVNQRVDAFRQLFPCGTIKTTLVDDANGRCLFKAEAYDGDKLLATGHAYEKESSSFINKTSYIENCETSAVGRCLGMLGIGICTSIASADEVTNAIENQSAQAKVPFNNASANVVDASMVATIRAEMERTGMTDEAFVGYLKKKPEELTVSEFTSVMNKFKKTPSKE